MDIIDFKKSLPARLEEFMLVLSWSNKLVPAAQVRDEWSYFLQLQIEPAGWQAIWKIPRAICEDLKISYPTAVLGLVEHVIFDELKAIFTIQGVEEENIHLPEKQEVKLEDLYVTRLQENPALNTEKTAEIIDNLRFFYKNIWMPWDYDDDDDLDWVKKHLESRLQFYYDLQKKVIKCSISNHIKNLLYEAKYIHDKRQRLEMNLSDDEELETSMLKTNVTDLLQLHLRLKLIKNEMDILENPEMRKVYENMDDNQYSRNESSNENSNILIVVKACSIEKLKSTLEFSESFMAKNSVVRTCATLQDAFKISKLNDQILLDSGTHTVKCVTNLHEKGMINGIFQAEKTLINSAENERVLFVIDGDFTLKNLTLLSPNIRTAVVVKSGTVNIINCHLIGDKDSSTKQGIYISGNSSLIIEGSLIENFAVGIKLIDEASVTINSTTLKGCGRAIEIQNGNKLTCNVAKISQSKTAAILYEIENRDLNDKCIIIPDFNKKANFLVPWEGDCTFEENICNIVVYNRKFGAYKFFEDDSPSGTSQVNLDDNYCDDNFYSS